MFIAATRAETPESQETHLPEVLLVGRKVNNRAGRNGSLCDESTVERQVREPLTQSRGTLPPGGLRRLRLIPQPFLRMPETRN
jgi:hypothetical protein